MSNNTDPREGLPSASMMGRLANCPGSWELATFATMSGEAKDEQDPVTQRGTRIHNAIANEELDSLDEEEADIAKRLIEMRDKALKEWRFRADPKVHERLLVERRMWIRNRSTNEHMCSAQVDFAIVAGERALILDYKSGFMPAPASVRNYQVRTQVVALKHEYPNLKQIRGAIASDNFRQGFDPVDYDENAIAMAERELIMILWRSNQTGTPRTGGPWCRWCPAKSICVEAAAFTMLPIASSDIGAGTTKMSKEDIKLEIDKMLPEQLAFVYRRSTLIRNILDDVTARLKVLPDDLLQRVGLRLSESDGKRKITDIVGMFHSLNKVDLMTNEELFGICETSLKSVEELVIPKLLESGTKTKKEAKSKISNMLKPFVSMVQSSPRLAERNEETPTK